MAKFKAYLTLRLSLLIIAIYLAQVFFGLDLAWEVGTVHMNFFLSMVAHGSPGHLLGNLFGLAFFGFILEKTVGTFRFGAVLLLAGIVGNLSAIPAGYGAVIGISGAVYGILGALTVLRPWMVVWLGGMPMPMAVAGLLWAGSSVLGLFAVNTNVGHGAHLAGIIVGFILGALWKKRYGGKTRKRRKLKKVNPRLDKELDKYEKRYMSRSRSSGKSSTVMRPRFWCA